MILLYQKESDIFWETVVMHVKQTSDTHFYLVPTVEIGQDIVEK